MPAKSEVKGALSRKGWVMVMPGGGPAPPGAPPRGRGRGERARTAALFARNELFEK